MSPESPDTILINQIATKLQVDSAAVNLICVVCRTECRIKAKVHGAQSLLQAIELKIQQELVVTPSVQLAKWGITSLEQIAKIVTLLEAFTLIEPIDLRLRDFKSMVAPTMEPEVDYSATQNAPTSPGSAKRWSIAGIFVVTTIVAAAMPGAKTFGVIGACYSVLTVWMTTIGGICLLIGIRNERGKLFAMVLGVFLMALGIAGYYLLVTHGMNLFR